MKQHEKHIWRYINREDANDTIFINRKIIDTQKANGDLVSSYKWSYTKENKWEDMESYDTLKTNGKTYSEEDGGFLVFRNIKYHDQTVEGVKYQCSQSKKWYFRLEGTQEFKLMKDEHRVVLEYYHTEFGKVEHDEEDYFTWKEITA